MEQKGDGSKYPIRRNVFDSTAIYRRLVAMNLEKVLAETEILIFSIALIRSASNHVVLLLLSNSQSHGVKSCK